MGKKEVFYQTQVDRTPYGACFLVGILATLLFVVGAYGLIKLGGVIQRIDWPGSSNAASGESTPDPYKGAQEKLQQIKQEASQRANDKVQEEIDAATDKAVDAATDSAKQQIQEQADQLKLPTLK